jgi:hypothetical protein
MWYLVGARWQGGGEKWLWSRLERNDDWGEKWQRGREMIMIKIGEKWWLGRETVMIKRWGKKNIINVEKKRWMKRQDDQKK